MPEPSQLDKFKALAKEAECDTDPVKFDKALKKVASSSRTEKSSDDNSDETNDRNCG